MTPAQFLARVKRNEIPPVCLFLGQESYNRRRCREALAAAKPGIESEQYDASETSLAAIIDDARALGSTEPRLWAWRYARTWRGFWTRSRPTKKLFQFLPDRCWSFCGVGELRFSRRSRAARNICRPKWKMLSGSWWQQGW